MKKRILSLILAALAAVSLLSSTAFAWGRETKKSEGMQETIKIEEVGEKAEEKDEGFFESNKLLIIGGAVVVIAGVVCFVIMKKKKTTDAPVFEAHLPPGVEPPATDAATTAEEEIPVAEPIFDDEEAAPAPASVEAPAEEAAPAPASVEAPAEEAAPAPVSVEAPAEEAAPAPVSVEAPAEEAAPAPTLRSSMKPSASKEETIDPAFRAAGDL